MGRGEESEIQELPDDFARWGVPVVLAEEAVSAIPTTFARRPNSAQTLCWSRVFCSTTARRRNPGKHETDANSGRASAHQILSVLRCDQFRFRYRSTFRVRGALSTGSTLAGGSETTAAVGGG